MPAPTLHQYATLANLAYENSHTPLPYGFKQVMDSRHTGHRQLGYRGLCFMHEEVIVIAHRGTEPAEKQNVKSDIEIALQQEPTSAHVAREFTQFCIERLTKKDQFFSGMLVVHVGHSLGGVLAHLCSLEYFNAYAIGFDNPGMSGLITLDALERQNRLYKHLSILSLPNLINQHGGHFGRVFSVRSQKSNPCEAPCLKGHRLGFLLSLIDPAQVDDPLEEYFKPNYGFACDRFEEVRARKVRLLKSIDQLFTQKPTPPRLFDHYGSKAMHSALVFKSDGEPEVIHQHRWFVSLISLGEGDGHSMIVVEGISKENKPLVLYNHLVFHPTKHGFAKAESFADAEGCHLLQHHYDVNKTASFKAEGDKEIARVEKMLTSISYDELNDEGFPYSRYAGHIYRDTPEVVARNCASWAISKLKIAGFHPRTIGVFAAPRKIKPHGVRPKASCRITNSKNQDAAVCAAKAAVNACSAKQKSCVIL